MKIAGSKFWGIVALSLVALILIVAGSVVWIKFQLTSAELDFITRLLSAHIGPLLIVALLLVVVCVWSLQSVFRNYIRPVPKITEMVNLINASNPSYRLSAAGGTDIRRLCERINEVAQLIALKKVQLDENPKPHELEEIELNQKVLLS